MYKSVSFSSFSSNDGKNVEAWRNKIDVPVFPPVGSRTGAISLKYRPIIAAVMIMLGLTLVYAYVTSTNAPFDGRFSSVQEFYKQRNLQFYNKTYPLSNPLSTSNGITFCIGLITDMDTDSKDPKKSNTWNSIFLKANLTYNEAAKKVSLDLGKKSLDSGGVVLSSSYAYKGRGMELSELIVFNGRLFTVDDRTGIVYEIIDNKVVPWVIMSDGNGKETKGFKGEWMLVKDKKLHVGGLGKEWTTGSGVVLHSNPQWIKVIDTDRSVVDVNWIDQYKAMQKSSGYTPPGYIIHESAVWSDIHRSWFFLPRRASHEKYDEVLDEERATNLLFRCSEDFSNIKVTKIGKLDYPARGYSSFKFIPGTRDRVIVALKSEELKGHTKSYMTAFTVDGDILMPDTLISFKYKYEGIEFL